MNIPLQAELVNIGFDFRGGSVELSQEAVHKFSAAHSGSGFCGAGQVDEDDFAHYFLIINSAAQMKLLLRLFWVFIVA
jgi:hypothetical protein